MKQIKKEKKSRFNSNAFSSQVIYWFNNGILKVSIHKTGGWHKRQTIVFFNICCAKYPRVNRPIFYLDFNKLANKKHRYA